MMINTEFPMENANVNSDFLNQLSYVRKVPKLKFPKYKLLNKKFINLVHKKMYFVLPYVVLSKDQDVNNLLQEIKWCSDNFIGQFAIKYTTNRSICSDRLVIAFESEEDQVLFLLRSDIGNCE